MQILKLDLRPEDDVESYRKYNINIGVISKNKKEYSKFSFSINEILRGNSFNVVASIRDAFTDAQPLIYLAYKYDSMKWGFHLKNKDYSDRFYETKRL
jgi:hypothetical protein